LRGVRAGCGFADLEPLRAIVSSARIVALGEATHGTREFFQLKHRLLEFLVRELGFTAFALEANWPEAQAVDDYVRHGRGDPAAALAGLRFWTWNTEEVLALIEWLRAYNAGGGRPVSFTGFDAQFSSALPGRRHAELRRQVEELRRAGDDAAARYAARDRAMAENLAWILEDEAKVVVWAHNGHVTRDTSRIFGGAAASMGMHLARRFDMVVVGFAFGAGGFRAVVEDERGRRPRAVSVGPPPDGSLDAALLQTGLPAFLLDLRDPPAWLREPQVTREIGAFFETPEAMCRTVVPAASYDVLAFVAATTPTRPQRSAS